MHKLISLVAMLAVWASTLAADAGWYKYPVFADDVADVVETPEKVYYLSGGNLFSYSPADEESYAYSSINLLSDNTISSIHYNPYGKFLLAIYDNSNIDAIYDDGTVINLPEIYNSQMAVKTVNHVSFSPTRFVLSTDFGIVVYDSKAMEVIESGNYGVKVNCAAYLGDNLVICTQSTRNSDYVLFYSPASTRHNDLNKFTEMAEVCVLIDMVPVADNALIGYAKDGYLRYYRIDYDKAKFSGYNRNQMIRNSSLRQMADGTFFTTTADALVTYTPSSDFTAHPLPDALKGQKLAVWSNPTRLWAGDANGIARYDISGSTPTVLNGKMIHAGATTVQNVGFLRFSPDAQRLYVSSLGVSNYRTAAPAERESYQSTNIIDLATGAITDASAYNVTANHAAIVPLREQLGSTRMYGDAGWVAEDPDDPSIYYCANNHEGVYVLKRNTKTGAYDQIGKFDLTNAKIADFWGPRVNDVAIDPAGNLWVGYRGDPAYSVLPAAKRRANPATITAADWKAVTCLNTLSVGAPDMKSLFDPATGCAFLSSNNHQQGITVVNTGGDWANTSAFKAKQHANFTDQDGNTFNFSVASFLIKDTRGAIWVGTTTGVFEIPNPAQFASGANTIVRRLKVPRNDGTNYADYLLDSDQINWIALDPAGRKWIATDQSGIFLVSAAGDQIIRTYNTSNSPLPSNTINAIECDPNTNTVYVGTPYGLYSFLSDASAPSEDMGNILAYPNPVRPEYDGNVTITGLMENSVVKIADTAGNVVYQTTSEGGMASWPCTNQAGKAVKSGVYYIIANSHSDSATKGATAKVTVIR